MSEDIRFHLLLKSTTNHETPTVLGWGFFLRDRARTRVSARVPADTCGLARSAGQRVSGLFSLSRGPSSLRPRSPRTAPSPQRPRRHPLQINELRADESSGCFSASAGEENRPDSESGECSCRRTRNGRFRSQAAGRHIFMTERFRLI